MEQATVGQLIGMLESAGGASFASFVYRSKGTNELAQIVVTLGHNTEDLYKMDLEILNVLKGKIDKVAEPLKYEACCKLIDSRLKSLEVGIGNNPAYTHQNTYVYPRGLKGFRVHKETGECYVSGLVHSKVTIEEGTFKEVKSRPITVAKKEIEKTLPSGKYRMYALTGIKKVTKNGHTVEIVTD